MIYDVTDPGACHRFDRRLLGSQAGGFLQLGVALCRKTGPCLFSFWIICLATGSAESRRAMGEIMGYDASRRGSTS